MKKVVFVAALGALCPLFPARAVVLEQKWTAGQQLSYETALRGTMNVQAPANANFPLAGVPLEIEIRGDGLTHLQTLSVDEKGVGTVTMRVPQFDLRAQTLGQKGQILLQNGTSRVTLNGQPIKFGDGTNPLFTPKTALRISSQGRVLGVQDLQPKTTAAPKKDDKPVAAAQAIDRSALVMASVIRALPTLWPGRDVQNGEKWKAEISWPVPSPTDPKKMVPTQFGAWDLTLKGAETVGGKILQRVGVVGTLAVDSAQLAPADAKDAKKPRGKGKQDVKGDVWLDAEAGQVVRADLIVDARAEGGKDAASQAWMDFTGTVQLNLKGAN
ncbi:MAG: hypothetical protein KY445_13885 [Armatimonadetes bacterium]|nr:hypothetical protein [Armatimonadota bacterium]